MKSNKLLILITALVIMIIVNGCTNNQTSTTVDLDDPYLGGSQGLVIEFEPMAPEQDGVDTIFNDEEFSVNLNIKNKGEYTVPANTVKSKIKGISSSDYTGLLFDATNTDEIEKISEYNENGGEINIDHKKGKLVQNRIQDRNLITATLFAEITYPYKTFISAPKVCFKDVTSKSRDDEICNVDSTLQVFSSGAPIKATSAEEIRSGKGLVSVTFYIENVGGGEVKRPDMADFDYRYDELAFTIQESSSPNKWDCRSAGRTGVGRFREDNTLEIVCNLKNEYQIGANEVYQSQLDLTLEYDYKILLSNDLVIRNNDI